MTEYETDNEVDTFNLSVGNCFQTQEEAEDINNILIILDSIKKYYQDKQREAKNG